MTAIAPAEANLPNAQFRFCVHSGQSSPDSAFRALYLERLRSCIFAVLFFSAASSTSPARSAPTPFLVKLFCVIAFFFNLFLYF